MSCESDISEQSARAEYERAGEILAKLISAATSGNAALACLRDARELADRDVERATGPLTALIGALEVFECSLNSEWQAWVDIADARSRKF